MEKYQIVINIRTLSGLNECKLVALDLWSKSVGLFVVQGQETLHMRTWVPCARVL